MRKSPPTFTFPFLVIIFTAAALGIGFYLGKNWKNFQRQESLLSPFIANYAKKKKNLPLQKYSIPNLKEYPFKSSEIQIQKIIKEFDEYTAYVFSYTTLDKKMTGQLNIPHATLAAVTPAPVIVMLRGFVPAEIYTTGAGTKNAAAVLAQNGYVTLAPDFFGFGDSDDDFKNSWKGRFSKPVSVIELIKSIRSKAQVEIPEKLLTKSDENAKAGKNFDADTEKLTVKLNPAKLGIWAHSNGGQIALATLEALSEPIPTTLWAPVTTPFPYSILFFSDEYEDEGKETRAWLAVFEEDYDVFDFTITKHLDKLTGPLQLHHGGADKAAIQLWSDEFVEKIEAENERRAEILEAKTVSEPTELDSDDEEAATKEAIIDLKDIKDLENSEEENNSPLEPIDITYYKYPGADHDMKPVWDSVIERDVKFLDGEL